MTHPRALGTALGAAIDTLEPPSTPVRLAELLDDATAADIQALPMPATMKAIVLRREDERRLRALPPEERQHATTLHLADVPVPEPEAGEVLVAVMAASLNYNTLWSARHEPMSPFRYLSQFAQLEAGNAKHNIDYQIVGSDACDVVVRTGPGVGNCKPGDRVVIHPGVVNGASPLAHFDSLRCEDTRAWGFETNFGSLAEFCLVRASQIMPKPEHLSWEEAASLPLVNSTVYRMLVSPNGAAMRLGESVLIWGAAGGLGSLAVQYVLRGGGHPIAIVSSPAKAELVRALGCEAVIDRDAEGYRFTDAEGEPNLRDLVRFRKQVRALNGGRDPDIVFEHTGRETFGASVFIGSHGANYHEACLANDLVCRGLIHPAVSAVHPLSDTLAGVERMRSNRHAGKIAILCQAPRPALGIRNHALRARLGEDRLSLFRRREPRAV